MKLLVLLSGILSTIEFLSQVTQAQTDDEIRQVLRERVDTAGRNQSLSVAVIDEKGTRFVAYGKTSANADAASVNRNTIYEIGSVSKVFTATLLADAVRRGEVKLDDPVAMHLPKTVKVPTRNNKQITLLRLVTHTSGLPRMPDNLKPKNPANPYADYTFEQMYEFLSAHELTRDIGETYDYSNLGTGLLEHALSLRARMSFEEMVKQRICAPLGMNDTGIALTPAMRQRLAAGHDKYGEAVSNWDFPVFAGAGGLRSTAADMAKFVGANMNSSDQTPANPVTSAAPALTAVFPQMHTVKAKTDEPDLSIGLGWHIAQNNGGELVWHNGETGGYRSFIGFDKSKRRGVVILSNTANSAEDIAVNLIKGVAPTKKVETLKPLIKLAPEVLEKYVGEYQYAPNFSIVVTREANRLFAQATNQQRLEMFATAETEFVMKAVPVTLNFVQDEKGAVTAMSFRQNGTEQTGKKIK